MKGLDQFISDDDIAEVVKEIGPKQLLHDLKTESAVKFCQYITLREERASKTKGNQEVDSLKSILNDMDTSGEYQSTSITDVNYNNGVEDDTLLITTTPVDEDISDAIEVEYLTDEERETYDCVIEPFPTKY